VVSPSPRADPSRQPSRRRPRPRRSDRRRPLRRPGRHAVCGACSRGGGCCRSCSRRSRGGPNRTRGREGLAASRRPRSHRRVLLSRERLLRYDDDDYHYYYHYYYYYCFSFVVVVVVRRRTLTSSSSSSSSSLARAAPELASLPPLPVCTSANGQSASPTYRDRPQQWAPSHPRRAHKLPGRG